MNANIFKKHITRSVATLGKGKVCERSADGAQYNNKQATYV